MSSDLNPCRECGKAPRFSKSEANDSTFGGSAGVYCECGNHEHALATDQAYNVNDPSKRGNTGWDRLADQLASASSSVVWRWNRLNPALRIRTEEELVAERRQHTLERCRLKHPTIDFNSWNHMSPHVPPKYRLTTLVNKRVYEGNDLNELLDYVWVQEFEYEALRYRDEE